MRLPDRKKHRIVVWALARQCPQCGAARRPRQAGVPVRPCLCFIFPLPSAANLAHTALDAAQSSLRRHLVGLLCITAVSAAAGCSQLRWGILLKNQGREDPNVRTTHAAGAGRPSAYAERAGEKRDWRHHNRHSNERVGKASVVRGGFSEHHTLDVRVGEVERRQTAAANRGASAFHDVLWAGRVRSRPRHNIIALAWPQHKDVPGNEVT